MYMMPYAITTRQCRFIAGDLESKDGATTVDTNQDDAAAAAAMDTKQDSAPQRAIRKKKSFFTRSRGNTASDAETRASHTNRDAATLVDSESAHDSLEPEPKWPTLKTAKSQATLNTTTNARSVSNPTVPTGNRTHRTLQEILGESPTQQLQGDDETNSRQRSKSTSKTGLDGRPDPRLANSPSVSTLRLWKRPFGSPAVPTSAAPSAADNPPLDPDFDFNEFMASKNVYGLPLSPTQETGLQGIVKWAIKILDKDAKDATKEKMKVSKSATQNEITRMRTENVARIPDDFYRDVGHAKNLISRFRNECGLELSKDDPTDVDMHLLWKHVRTHDFKNDPGMKSFLKVFFFKPIRARPAPLLKKKKSAYLAEKLGFRKTSKVESIEEENVGVRQDAPKEDDRNSLGGRTSFAPSSLQDDDEGELAVDPAQRRGMGLGIDQVKHEQTATSRLNEHRHISRNPPKQALMAPVYAKSNTETPTPNTQAGSSWTEPSSSGTVPPLMIRPATNSAVKNVTSLTSSAMSLPPRSSSIPSVPATPIGIIKEANAPPSISPQDFSRSPLMFRSDLSTEPVQESEDWEDYIEEDEKTAHGNKVPANAPRGSYITAKRSSQHLNFHPKRTQSFFSDIQAHSERRYVSDGPSIHPGAERSVAGGRRPAGPGHPALRAFSETAPTPTRATKGGAAVQSPTMRRIMDMSPSLQQFGPPRTSPPSYPVPSIPSQGSKDSKGFSPSIAYGMGNLNTGPLPLPMPTKAFPAMSLNTPPSQGGSTVAQADIDEYQHHHQSPLEDEIDSVANEWKAATPGSHDTPTFDERHATFNDSTLVRKALFVRHQLGLETLYLRNERGRQHPNHAYDWTTVNVMCAYIHIDEMFDSDPTLDDVLGPAEDSPSVRKKITAPQNEIPNTTSVETKFICTGSSCFICEATCCYFAEIIGLTKMPPSRLPDAQRLIETAKRHVQILSEHFPWGMENYDSHMKCTACERVFCYKHANPCKRMGCKEVLCEQCGDLSHGFCDEHLLTSPARDEKKGDRQLKQGVSKMEENVGKLEGVLGR